MNVYCSKCKYDSGDRDEPDKLAIKVTADGGRMVMTYGPSGQKRGWDIACPKGHSGREVHLD